MPADMSADVSLTSHPMEAAIFRQLDTNNNGTLEREEVQGALEKLGEEGLANILMEKLDVNADGVVSFAEFVDGFKQFGEVQALTKATFGFEMDMLGEDVYLSVTSVKSGREEEFAKLVAAEASEFRSRYCDESKTIVAWKEGKVAMLNYSVDLKSCSGCIGGEIGFDLAKSAALFKSEGDDESAAAAESMLGEEKTQFWTLVQAATTFEGKSDYASIYKFASGREAELKESCDRDKPLREKYTDESRYELFVGDGIALEICRDCIPEALKTDEMMAQYQKIHEGFKSQIDICSSIVSMRLDPYEWRHDFQLELGMF